MSRDDLGYFTPSAHLDVYLNYRCNLRCRHCFMGASLSQGTEMSWAEYAGLLRAAHAAGMRKLALLGGEPTLYRRIDDAVSEGFEVGFNDVRLVTNGMQPLARFVHRFDRERKPLLVFSIDGATRDTHDLIRGPRAFETLNSSIELAQGVGYRCAAIVTLSRRNVHELAFIVQRAADRGFEYVNVHRMNPAGFGGREPALSSGEWGAARELLVLLSRDMDMPLRLDGAGEWHPAGDVRSPGTCVVRDQAGGNTMVMPDGRVYRCALFIDEHAMHSATWNGGALRSCTAAHTERSVCASDGAGGCPGLRFLTRKGLGPGGVPVAGCMYRKVIIARGDVSDDEG